MRTPIVIECKDLSKTFVQTVIPVRTLQDRLLRPHLLRNTKSIAAVKKVTVTIRKGEWVGIFGPNGSGKTTFLKMIAGLLKPNAGTLSVNGTLSSFFELGIGFHPERRADENIYLHGILWGLDSAQIRRMTKRVIDFAGVHSHADLPLKSYSTGMRMRLAFAAAAEIDADIFLFDEIFAVGDEDFQSKCVKYFDRLKAKGKTVLIVNHNFDHLYRCSERILYFHDGEITGQKRRIPA